MTNPMMRAARDTPSAGRRTALIRHLARQTGSAPFLADPSHGRARSGGRWRIPNRGPRPGCSVAVSYTRVTIVPVAFWAQLPSTLCMSGSAMLHHWSALRRWHVRAGSVGPQRASRSTRVDGSATGHTAPFIIRYARRGFVASHRMKCGPARGVAVSQKVPKGVDVASTASRFGGVRTRGADARGPGRDFTSRDHQPSIKTGIPPSSHCSLLRAGAMSSRVGPRDSATSVSANDPATGRRHQVCATSAQPPRVPAGR